MRLFEAIIEENHRAIAGGQSADISCHHVSQPVTNCHQLKAVGIQLVTNCNQLKTLAAEQAKITT